MPSSQCEDEGMSDDLLEISETATLTREQAADRLRAIADQLSKHNRLDVRKDGLKFVVDVPDRVELEIELEVGETNELEIEIRW
jgi:amphi-Trp domain-containing protein